MTARRQRLRRRSAAVYEGKALEGVNGESGMAARTIGSCKVTEGRRGRKRLEPHGWMQGAIDLRGSVRSKPSKSGGTTRAEGVGYLAVLSRRQQALSGAGRLGEDSRNIYGGRAIFGQPQERQSGKAGKKARSASADRAGRPARKDGTHR